MRLKSILACLIASPLLIAAAEPRRLQPSTPWSVDRSGDFCRLIRNFGAGKTSTKLTFESEFPGQLDIIAVGKPLNSLDRKVPAKFLPIGSKVGDGRVAKSVSTGDPAIIWSGVEMLPDDVIARKKENEDRQGLASVRPGPEIAADQTDYGAIRKQFAAQATEIEVDNHRSHPVILETGALFEPLAAIDECDRQALKEWGADPDLQDKIARPAWNLTRGGWLTSDDYPPNMVDLGEESDVTIRALIDATGKITKCSSFSAYKSPEFNEIVCARFIERVRFQPAELADGTRVPSYVTVRVSFQMQH